MVPMILLDLLGLYNVVADTSFDDASVLVKATALPYGMPGADVLQLRHHLDKLLYQHRRETSRTVFCD